jgi:hypothetical protein
MLNRFNAEENCFLRKTDSSANHGGIHIEFTEEKLEPGATVELTTCRTKSAALQQSPAIYH